MSKPIVCIVGTGGTIASKYDAALGGHVAAAGIGELAATVPEIAEFAQVYSREHGYLSGIKARILLMVALAHTQDRGELGEIFANA
jgi:L-asparaginase/Glu-tRNA(Gln) amidotransferase subunit D